MIEMHWAILLQSDLLPRHQVSMLSHGESWNTATSDTFELQAKVKSGIRQRQLGGSGCGSRIQKIACK